MIGVVVVWWWWLDSIFFFIFILFFCSLTDSLTEHVFSFCVPFSFNFILPFSQITPVALIRSDNVGSLLLRSSSGGGAAHRSTPSTPTRPTRKNSFQEKRKKIILTAVERGRMLKKTLHDVPFLDRDLVDLLVESGCTMRTATGSMSSPTAPMRGGGGVVPEHVRVRWKAEAEEAAAAAAAAAVEIAAEAAAGGACAKEEEEDDDDDDDEERSRRKEEMESSEIESEKEHSISRRPPGYSLSSVPVSVAMSKQDSSEEVVSPVHRCWILQDVELL